MENNFDLGVHYAPNATPTTIPLKDLTSPWGEPPVCFVRIIWTDCANVVRFRVVPLAYFEKMVKSSRPGVTMAAACLGILNCRPADGFSAVGEVFLSIDLTSIRLCPYAPKHAIVMGFIQQKHPVCGPNGKLSVQSELCPRSALKRVVQQARTEHGAEFLVGFESEFNLLKSTSPAIPASVHEYSASNSLRAGQTCTIVMDEIAGAIIEAGIELQMYHAEAAPGQFEVVTGPLPPLEAADALVLTREIIHNIAAKHGLHATFAPRIFESIGTAAHAHISVHSTRTEDKKVSEQLSRTEEMFLAGLMEHLPSLSALTLPTTASYRRVGDGLFSGGTYVCWGTEHRECPVRLTNAKSPSSRRFEMRFIDGTANPYLALAGILGAGVAGLRDKKNLDVKDCNGAKSAAEMTEEERAALGISLRMSRTWDEARINFIASQEMGAVFGDEFKTTFLSVGKRLKEYLEEGSEEERNRHLIELY